MCVDAHQPHAECHMVHGAKRELTVLVLKGASKCHPRLGHEAPSELGRCPKGNS